VTSGLLSPWHIVLVAIIALLVFGPKRLPELGRSLGSGMRGFKQAISGEDDERRDPGRPVLPAEAAAAGVESGDSAAQPVAAAPPGDSAGR
jgi:sec-independent protein translocase protein TatA